MNRVLRAAIMMGASSLVTIAVGAARNKVIALTLGPEGLGALGLISTALLVLTTIFSLGMGQSGVQSISSTNAKNPALVPTYARALLFGTLALGTLAAACIVFFQQSLAVFVLHDPKEAHQIRWLAIAVFASVALAGQRAYLNGIGQLRLLAQSSAIGSFLGGSLAVVAVLLFKRDGIGMAVAAVPLGLWLTSLVSGWRFNASTGVISWSALLGPTKTMMQLGVAVSGAMLVTTMTQFFVRAWLEHTLGLAEAGKFQAAWDVSSAYMGFVLGALAAEYYPRISGVVDNVAALNGAVNQEFELMLLIGVPAILLTMLVAPQLIQLLYAQDFASATMILRWQLVGDVGKIGVWTIGFLMLARTARRKFFLAELSWNLVYALLIVAFASRFGIGVSGWAYLIAYATNLALCLRVVRLETSFKLSSGARQALGLGVVAVLISFVSLEFGGAFGWWLSLVIFLVSLIFSIKTLRWQNAPLHRLHQGVV
jgi:enterobacterial common antigen flippase